MANEYRFKITANTSVYAGTSTTQVLAHVPELYPGDEVIVEPVSDGWYRIKGIVAKDRQNVIDGGFDQNQVYYIPLATEEGKINAGDYANAKLITNSSNVTTTKVSGTALSVIQKNIDPIVDRVNQKVVYYDHTVIETNFENTRQPYSTNIQQLRGVLGIPHQFLPTADPRLNSGQPLEVTALGRMYYTHILKTMPLLFITPGVPEFVPSATLAKSDLGQLIDSVTSSAGLGVNDASKTYSGKYYTLKFSYVDYFHYVTPMLRLAATWLGIGNVSMDGCALRKYNWLFGLGDNQGTGNNTGWFTEWLKSFMGGSYSKLFGRDTIIFYANCGENTSDSFSNSITQSGLASTINNLSDSAREMQFVLGTAGAMGGETASDAVKGMKPAASDGGGDVIQGIVDKCKAIMTGGRLVFPQIWADSNFSRSYSCSLKLVSPSGDKLSVFLNIIVPIFHILGFTVARQTNQGGQTYESPFLVRAYYKGMFNVDMGIVESLNITKGTEGEWTVDGLPTVADVTFEIKDLYDGMFIAKDEALNFAPKFMSNVTELDYIANCCGINVNQMEGSRISYYGDKLSNITEDLSHDILGSIGQYAANVFQRMFGTF